MTRLTSFPFRPPLGPGFSFADHVSGLYASMALLGALERRRRTGEGLFIDISEVEVMKDLLDDGTPEPSGNSSPTAAPHDVYPCRGKDRWCAISVFTEEEWAGFKRAVGNPAWAEDKKFATLAGRIENKAELDGLLGTWTERHSAATVMAKLRENGVAAGLVQDAAGFVRDPQLKARGFFIDRPEIGKLVDATPIRLSGASAQYNLPAPFPGRDNDFVYGQLLGLTKAEMAELREKGVI
jgi:benzylsuccinate CoA-transferase BbsF subunit